MKFAMTGAAGYVAPRHMAAIKAVGGNLVAVLDPHDSVGILDKDWPRCLYFREPERFDRYLSKHPVDYLVVCSPNYLHDSHCLMGLRSGAHVICEKPLVLREDNLENLSFWESETARRINVILQCRLHPASVAAKTRIASERQKMGLELGYSVDVDYQAPRGAWYDFSWKGDQAKSGGILSNIGIHLFDLCCWFFGDNPGGYNDPLTRKLMRLGPQRAAYGSLNFQRAKVKWRLSTALGEPKREFVITSIHSESFNVDLTNGFSDLHTKSYVEILACRGWGIEDIRPATRLVENLRERGVQYAD